MVLESTSRPSWIPLGELFGHLEQDGIARADVEAMQKYHLLRLAFGNENLVYSMRGSRRQCKRYATHSANLSLTEPLRTEDEKIVKNKDIT